MQVGEIKKLKDYYSTDIQTIKHKSEKIKFLR